MTEPLQRRSAFQLNRRTLIRAAGAAALLATVGTGCSDSTPDFILRPELDPDADEPCQITDWPPTPRATWSTFLGARGYVLPPISIMESQALPDVTKVPPWIPPVPGTGRIAKRFRTAIRDSAPAQLLAMSALENLSRNQDDANAYADLAVSGRVMWTRFAQRPPSVDDIAREIRQVGQAFPVQPAPDALQSAIQASLARAYAVAYALRSGALQSNPQVRRDLGYIAVCEDDPPHRPVNVPASQFNWLPSAQWEEAVTVRGVPLTIRCVAWWFKPVVHAVPWPPPNSELEWRPDLFDEESTLRMPEGQQVVLYIHGHSSRAEEASSLAVALNQEAERRGRQLILLSMDLPGCGYSTHLTPESVGDLRRGDGSDNSVAFCEETIVALVAHLNLERRLVGVIGGSLGGNLTLRLAEHRVDQGRDWPRYFVAWDPGSVWPSFATMPDPIPGRALNHAQDAAGQVEETDDARADYFFRVFTADYLVKIGDDPIPKVVQADEWYRKDWTPCRTVEILSAVLDRYEVYDASFRRWHWTLAVEQLAGSHIEPRKTNPPVPKPYLTITGPLLLLNGALDNPDYAEIASNTRKLGELLADTPGAYGAHQQLARTGHSIHAERPVLLARLILDFFNW